MTWSPNEYILYNDLGRVVQIATEAQIHSVVYSGQVHTPSGSCVELYSELQVHLHLDNGDQNGLSWGLCASVCLFPELYRSK